MSATAGTPALQVRDATLRFGGIVALDEVSLQVPRDTIVGLIGPNGAGKTTLFGVCSGLVRPTSGSVLIDGHDVTRASPQARARRGLARTFQRPEIFFTMTVREHLELAFHARSAPRRVLADVLVPGGRRRADRAAAARVDSLLDALGLGSVQHRRAATLPLGLQRSLEVARGLAGSPKLLLLDEPSSGLDMHETEQLGVALGRAARSEGISLLLVEHDLDLVLGLSDHVYVLDFGELIAEGTPAEVRSSPLVQAAYLGLTSDERDRAAES